MVTIIKKGTPLTEIRKQINEIIYRSKDKGILKYAGKLKLDIDPLDFQIEIRNEWE